MEGDEQEGPSGIGGTAGGGVGIGGFMGWGGGGVGWGGVLGFRDGVCKAWVLRCAVLG